MAGHKHTPTPRRSPPAPHHPALRRERRSRGAAQGFPPPRIPFPAPPARPDPAKLGSLRAPRPVPPTRPPGRRCAYGVAAGLPVRGSPAHRAPAAAGAGAAAARLGWAGLGSAWLGAAGLGSGRAEERSGGCGRPGAQGVPPRAMRAAAGSVPAVRPELGPKSSRALHCLLQAAPISTASTLSIGDRGEEEKEAEEEEVGKKEEGARGWQPQLALMSTNIFKVQQGISLPSESPSALSPLVAAGLPGPAGGPAEHSGAPRPDPVEWGRRAWPGEEVVEDGGWHTFQAGRFKCRRCGEGWGWRWGTRQERK